MSESTGWWTKLKEEYNIETDQSGAVKTNTSRSGGSSPAGSGNRASGDGSAQAGGWWSNLKKEYNIDANLRAAEITDYAKDLGRYVGAATGYAGAKVAGGVMGGMVHGQSDPAPKTEQKAAPRGATFDFSTMQDDAKAHTDAAYYLKKAENSANNGRYKNTAYWMNRMINADLTPEERQKAADEINRYYDEERFEPKATPEWEAYSLAQRVLWAKDEDVRQYADLVTDNETRSLIQEVYGIDGQLAFQDPEEYARRLRQASERESRAFLDDEATMDYVLQGRENYLTANATADFTKRTDAEIERANRSEAHRAQMKSYTNATRAALAIEQLAQQVDEEGNSEHNISGTTAQYLIRELAACGVDLSGMDESNFRTMLGAARTENGRKLALMRGTLAGEGYDVDAILERVKYDREKEYQTAREESYKAWAQRVGTGDAIAASLASVGESVLLKPLEAMGTFSRIADGAGVNNPNEYVPLVGQLSEADMIRNALSGEMSPIGQFFYNAVMSTADSTGNVMAFGGTGSLITMGLTAAGTQAEAILQQGGSRGQAIRGGIAAGLIEILTEKFSVENLIHIKADTKTMRELLKSVGVQMFTEGSEEIAGEVLDILVDSVNMGNLSDNSEAVRRYINQGMTYEDAKLRVLMDNAMQIAESGAAGAVSGGLSGGAFGAYGTVKNRAAQNQYDAVMDKIEQRGFQSGVTMTEEQRRQAVKQLQERAQELKRKGDQIAAKQTERFATGVQNSGESIRALRDTTQTEQEMRAQQQATEEASPVAPAEQGQLQEVYEQARQEMRQNAKSLNDDMLRAFAASIAENLNNVQSYAEASELAQIEGQLAGLREEISRREAVSRNAERVAAAGNTALTGKVDEFSANWEGSREEETGNRQQTTVDGRQIASGAETGKRIATGPAALRNDNEGGLVARAAETGERIATAPAGPRNDNIEGGMNNGTAGEGFADGVQRDAGLGAEGQAGGLGEGTGGSVGRSQKSQELAQLRNYVQARADQRRGSAALGVLDGTNKVNNILIEGEGLTRTLREIQADAARDGVRVSFVTGTIETVTDGVGRTGGGVFQIDRDGTPHLFIQADSRSYSPRQIYDHERFHAIVAANRGIWSDIVEHLYETHSTEEIRQMVDAYVQAYDGCYGYEEADAEKYLEEIFADVYAEMQRGGGQQRAARELAGDTAQRFAGDIENARQNRAGIDNRNGPGTRLAIDSRNNVIVDDDVTPASVHNMLTDVFNGKYQGNTITFPVLKHTPQVFRDYCYQHDDRSFVMPSDKAFNAMHSGTLKQHGLGINGLEEAIQKLYTPEYILYQKAGKNKGHFAAIVMLGDTETLVAIELGDYRSGPAASVNGEDGYYNVIITAFNDDPEYIDNLINNDEISDIRYDKSVDKQYEAPEHVASGETPFGLATVTSYNDSIAQGSENSKGPNENNSDSSNNEIDWIGSREEPGARMSAADEDDALSVDWIGSREEKAANKGSYKWSEIRGRVSGMNEGQRKALVEQAAELDEATWRENGLGIKPYSGSLNDTEAILKYVDDAVDTVKAEGSYDYDPSFDIEALGENKESYSRLSAAAEDDALSVDWLGNREETTPSPQGKGAAEDGGPMKASDPTGENFEAMAREKKVALAEKTGIDGLKSRVKTAEERLRMWQAMEKSGLAAQDAKSVQELKNRIADAQETVNIFREELARKQDAKKAVRTDPAQKKEQSVRRRDEKAALRKEAELADNKPRQARKEFRQDALNLFGIQAGKRQALGNILNSFADRLLAQGSVNEADRTDLFRQLYEAGVEVVPAGALERMIRETVKDGRIYVPESVRQEFGDDWTAFRERAWGNGIYLTNNQSDRGADSWNAELAEVFPGSFDAEETDARNMLENIVDLAEEGKAEFVSIGEMMKRNQAETGVTVDQQMDELEQKVDKLIDTFAQKAQLEIDVRKQGTMKLVKERQRNRETAAREVQRRKENATRSQVMKQLRQLNKMRKKSEPVIQKQIDAIIGNLDIMARSISPEGMENLQALARKYMEAAEDPNFLGNPYVEARLARLNKVQLDNLEISDVIELGRTISALVKTVTEDKRLLTDARDREIADAAKEVNKEIKSSAGSKGGKLREFLGNEHLSPTRELQRLGGWVQGGMMEQLSRSLEDGGTRRMEYMRQATRIFDDFLSDKANQEWLRKAQGKDAEWITITAKVGVTGEDVLSGEAGPKVFKDVTFELTPMMRVGLLMHSKNKDNLRHIDTGGIVIPNKECYLKGNLADADAKGLRVKIQPEIVRAIVKDCTAQERAFASLLEQYYDGFSKEKINEVSMLIDGFERAGGEHYYGIKVSRKFLAALPEQIQKNMSLESIGSIVNERVHAGNPIILEDASTALKDHIDLISKYYGYTAPIRDFNAVMNYTFHFTAETKGGGEYVANAFSGSVKETLQAKWGAGAQKYIDDLLGDLQQSSGINETAAAFLAKLRGNLAGASLMFNPAVAISQTASLPGAMQTLGLGGVTAALKPEKVDMQLVEKYTPILWYRNQGNSTQELGDYMKEQGITGKMPWFFNWIQKMDSWTIRRIWAGAEYRVSKDTDLAPGSKEEIEAGTDPYYQEVARVFNRAVYDTQPNYSEMQRPGILRSESDLTKSLTMYKTVPLQYYNMMYEAVGRLRADNERAKASPNDRKAQADLKESKSFAAKTFVGILGANVTYVVIKALVKALTGRGKKYQDDDGKYTPESVLGRLGLDLTETYAGSIIGGSDLLNAGEKLYGAITTGKYSSYGGTEISMISAIEDTLGELYNLAAKLHKEDYTGGIGAVKELAKQLAVDFGFPANNMETYLLAMTKWISPEWADRYENFFDEFQRADLKGEHGRNLTAAVRVLMDNRTDGLSDDAVDELVRLWESGKIMQIPNAVPWSVSVGGNDITLGSEGRSKFREEWSRYVSSGLDSLIKDKAYRKASDADKAAMIKKLYDFATAAAKKSTVIGYEPDKWVNVGIAAVKAGVPTAQYVVFAQQLKTINGKDDDGETITGLKNQRSVELLRDTGWTDAQQELVYLQSSMTSDSAAARVQGLRDAGLTWDQTCDVVSTVGGDWAKATAIIDSDASNSAKLKALEYYLSGSTLRTAQVGVDYHVDLKLWADARTQADTDGNGSINQAEATAYLDELNVSWEDKAYIWQMVCYSSKWAKNPYSTTLGEDIWHSLHPDD